MNVGFHTHPFAMDVPGGGEVQLLKYADLLAENETRVWFHDTWNPQFKSLDIFHHFHLLSGSLGFLDYIRRLGLPIAVSTNIWIDDSNKIFINVQELEAYLSISDIFIVNSREELLNLADNIHVDLSRGRVLYNGVDADYGNPINTAPYEALLNFSGAYILNVANIEPRKNQLRLTRAAKRLGLPLVMIGGVRDLDYLKECQSVWPHVNHLGRFPRGSSIIKAAMQHAPLFALPSTFETPGLAALEAAVSGTNILITTGGSTREYFQDFVEYVDPYSEDDLCNAVARSIDRKSETDALQKHIIKNFAWPAIGKRLLEIYQSMLSGTK